MADAALLCCAAGCWQGDAAAALARYQQAARFLSWTSFKLRDDGGDVDMSPEEQVRLCSGRGRAVLMPGIARNYKWQSASLCVLRQQLHAALHQLRTQ
jgi:hypothetical protein